MSEIRIEILIKEVVKQNSACSHCRIKFMKKKSIKKSLKIKGAYQYGAEMHEELWEMREGNAERLKESKNACRGKVNKAGAGMHGGVKAKRKCG